MNFANFLFVALKLIGYGDLAAVVTGMIRIVRKRFLLLPVTPLILLLLLPLRVLAPLCFLPPLRTLLSPFPLFPLMPVHPFFD